MKPPEIVNATQAQLDDLLAKVKSTLTTQDYLLLEGVLGTFVCVMLALQNAKTSIRRFRKMLFGASTESIGNVLKDKDKDAAATDKLPAAGEATSAEDEPACDTECDPEGKPAKAKPGHGRIGAQAYRDAPVVKLDVGELQSGDVCPECTDGKVYNTPPRTIVKVIGQPPLVATVYELGRLRCRLCDATFTAPMPGLTITHAELGRRLPFSSGSQSIFWIAACGCQAWSRE